MVDTDWLSRHSWIVCGEGDDHLHAPIASVCKKGLHVYVG
jgi:hypothetical protein